MRRAGLIAIALIIVGCEGRVREVPLQFTKRWIAGEADIGRRAANGIPVTIRLRLADPEAFSDEFNIREPFGMTCHQARLLYRETPSSAHEVLTPRWSHIGRLWSHDPQVCFYATVEWEWNVLIAAKRLEMLEAIDGRLVLITGEEVPVRAEIALQVLTIPRSSEDFDKLSREGADAFVVATSQWLPLARR